MKKQIAIIAITAKIAKTSSEPMPFRVFKIRLGVSKILAFMAILAIFFSPSSLISRFEVMFNRSNYRANRRS